MEGGMLHLYCIPLLVVLVLCTVVVTVSLDCPRILFCPWTGDLSLLPGTVGVREDSASSSFSTATSVVMSNDENILFFHIAWGLPILAEMMQTPEHSGCLGIWTDWLRMESSRPGKLLPFKWVSPQDQASCSHSNESALHSFSVFFFFLIRTHQGFRFLSYEYKGVF